MNCGFFLLNFKGFISLKIGLINVVCMDETQPIWRHAVIEIAISNLTTAFLRKHLQKPVSKESVV